MSRRDRREQTTELTVSLPTGFVEAITEVVRMGRSASASDLVRATVHRVLTSEVATRHLLRRHEEERETGPGLRISPERLARLRLPPQDPTGS